MPKQYRPRQTEWLTVERTVGGKDNAKMLLANDVNGKEIDLLVYLDLDAWEHLRKVLDSQAQRLEIEKRKQLRLAEIDAKYQEERNRIAAEFEGEGK